MSGGNKQPPPTIGRIVHVVEAGNRVLPGIVVCVDKTDWRDIDLRLFTDNGLNPPHLIMVPHESHPGAAHDGMVWRWPERV